MKILAFVVLIASVLVLVFSIIAFIDPADAKLSDNGDPFGTPPSRVSIGIEIAASIICIGASIAVLNRRKNLS